MGVLNEYSFEGGTNGGSATTATTGASSVLAGAFTHQSSAAKIGSLGLQVSFTTNANCRFPVTANLTQRTTFWVKIPNMSAGQTQRTFASVRSASGVIGRFWATYASASTATVYFVPAASGTATLLGTVSTGVYTRVAAWFVVAATSTGAFHVRLFDASDVQIGSDTDITNANMGTANIEAYDIGSLGSFAEAPQFQFDGLRTEDGASGYLAAMSLSNTAPTANAGPDQWGIAAGSTVQLDGTDSIDTDGTIASYAWSQTAGTTVSLSSASDPTPTFTAPSNSGEVLTFQLLVTDNAGGTATDSVDIAVLGTIGSVTTYNFDGSDGATATLGSTGATTIANAGGITHAASYAVSGTTGLKFDATNSNTLVRFATAANTGASWSLWAWVPTLQSGATSRTLLTLRYASGVIGRFQASYVTASTVSLAFVPSAGGSVTLGTFTSGTRYRFAMWAALNTTSTGRIGFRAYNTSGTQVGSDVVGTGLNLGSAAIEGLDLGVVGTYTEQIVWGTDTLQTQTGILTYLSDTNIAPSVSVSSSSSTLFPGETATITAVISDSDGTIVSTNWSTTAGSLSGSGSTRTLLAPPLLNDQAATVTVSATDNLGAITVATATITLKASMSKMYDGTTWVPLVERLF